MNSRTLIINPLQARSYGMRFNSFPLVASAFLFAACTQETTAPSARSLPGAPVFAKSTATNAASTWKLPLDATGLGLVSDNQYGEGANSVYDNGVCGVTSQIFNATGSISGDATLQTNNPTAKANGCAAYPRKMSVVYPVNDPQYPNGGSETMAVFLNVRNISNPATVIRQGYANRVERAMAVNPTQSTRCDAWRWNIDVGGDDVWVERIDARTYHVYTKDRDPDPLVAAANAGVNRATCTTTGQQHHLPVDLLIVSKQDLPL
ncbi:MAG: hypothetical protein ABJC63_02870 [Gemmatimonadales bacterium]